MTLTLVPAPNALDPLFPMMQHDSASLTRPPTHTHTHATEPDVWHRGLSLYCLRVLLFGFGLVLLLFKVKCEAVRPDSCEPLGIVHSRDFGADANDLSDFLNQIFHFPDGWSVDVAAGSERRFMLILHKTRRLMSRREEVTGAA